MGNNLSGNGMGDFDQARLVVTDTAVKAQRDERARRNLAAWADHFYPGDPQGRREARRHVAQKHRGEAA